ncbi:hypothetical protein [Paracoccus albus]|uniref:hypothetical protein n=1 Tax=Paracoccus albus TaxID=3017784 RepID=UPI0022F03586|nr:hypothetical protein [Paracoccus albus]WBU60868.1 hypothetical protein PAF20_02800 [Paracoccus albus]
MKLSLSDGAAIIPVLSLCDVAAGVEMLKRVFGFDLAHDDAFGLELVLGNQRLRVVERFETVGALRAQHLALSVPDTDVAMHECLARGGTLANTMTPNGPEEIDEFWEQGVRYVFFDGPEGSLIELCAKKGSTGSPHWGHDHIGICCDEVGKEASLFLKIGCKIVAKHTLLQPDSRTEVMFLERGDTIIELFTPPEGGIGVAGCSAWLGCLHSPEDGTFELL